jgi:hypothetical protein
MPPLQKFAGAAFAIYDQNREVPPQAAPRCVDPHKSGGESEIPLYIFRNCGIINKLSVDMRP